MNTFRDNNSENNNPKNWKEKKDKSFTGFTERDPKTFKSPNYKPKSQMVFGKQPVLEALNAGQSFDKIFVYAEKQVTDEVLEIFQLAKRAQVLIQKVPIEKLNRLTNLNHQGIIALISPLKYYDVQDIIDQANAQGEFPFLVFLDGITDVRNIGNIARTALCFGAHALVLTQQNSGLISDETIKASAGALMHIPVCKVWNWEQAIEACNLNGIKIFASDLKATTKLQEIDTNQPLAVVLGSEGFGISKTLSETALQSFTIPINPKFDSLNVGVAAGIIFNQIFASRL